MFFFFVSSFPHLSAFLDSANFFFPDCSVQIIEHFSLSLREREKEKDLNLFIGEYNGPLEIIFFFKSLHYLKNEIPLIQRLTFQELPQELVLVLGLSLSFHLPLKSPPVS